MTRMNTSSSIDRINNYTYKLLENNNVPVEFSEDIRELTSDDVAAEPCAARMDLRDLACFTIDCDDTKDMDDAVSIQREGNGYVLGVHIADVAAYVTPFSILDEEATYRGTSVYLPNMTIPMLPAFLSNDLCSLNPFVDRNAISVLIHLNRNGKVSGYSITKSLIRSRVQGKYSEVNRLFTGDAPSAIYDKYASVFEQLEDMRAVAVNLRQHRMEAGANISADKAPKVILTKRGVELRCVEKGIAEEIIEEFMVLANSLVAEYFEAHNIPTIYRTQARKQTLAEYATDAEIHAELALERYVHFTSPIRRLADLKVNQMLTGYLNGLTTQELQDTYGEELEYASEEAVRRSRRANSIERACLRFCYGQYFLDRQSYTYSAHVTGFTQQNRPIISIDEYQVTALGSAALRTFVGEAVSIRVEVETRTGRLLAHRVWACVA